MSKIVKQATSNLRRGNPAWKKGVSGNPNGRKKKEDCLVSCIKEELERLETEDSELTRQQMIAKALVYKAVMGDLTAMKMCLDYVSGSPVATQKLIGEKGAITIRVINA